MSQHLQLSTLNQATVGEALVVSADLANVIENAKLIHEKSAGAFDVSLKPLWICGVLVAQILGQRDP